MSQINLEFVLAGRQVKFAMNIDSDSAVDQALMYALRVGGCCEPEVADLMARTCKPGDYVIDGGANIGFFTLLLSQLVGATGQVLSVEPGSNNLFKLRENIKLNNCSNVEIVPNPLWDRTEIIGLHLCADGSKNSLQPHADTRGIELLETVLLNSYWNDHYPFVRLIKLDIEGAEEAALRGGIKLLGADVDDGCPYIVLELNIEALPKFSSSVAKVCDFLRSYGYSPFLLHPNGALPTYIPRKTKVIPNRLNWNVLFATFDMVGTAWPEISS